MSQLSAVQLRLWQIMEGISFNTSCEIQNIEKQSKGSTWNLEIQIDKVLGYVTGRMNQW